VCELLDKLFVFKFPIHKNITQSTFICSLCELVFVNEKAIIIDAYTHPVDDGVDSNFCITIN